MRVSCLEHLTLKGDPCFYFSLDLAEEVHGRRLGDCCPAVEVFENLYRVMR